MTAAQTPATPALTPEQLLARAARLRESAAYADGRAHYDDLAEAEALEAQARQLLRERG